MTNDESTNDECRYADELITHHVSRITYHAVSGSTRLVGVIGWPVSHSRSPQMHNAAYAALGLDWAYVPLPVAPERVGDAVRGLVALGFAGRQRHRAAQAGGHSVPG